MRTRSLILSFLLAACAPGARAELFAPPLQWFTPVADLGRTADVIAYATVDSIVVPGGQPNSEIMVRLRLAQALKGSPDSQVVVASIESGCSATGTGGGGGIGSSLGHLYFCLALTPETIGSTGLWFLKSADSGYRIVPRAQSRYRPDDLYLPVAIPPAPDAGALTDQLLAAEVRWFQSIPNPDYRRVDDSFFNNFDRRGPESPTPQQVLAAVRPLIDSPYPGQHAVGIIIALHVDSVDAMTQVLRELPALKGNPRFPEIVSAIGSFPKDRKKDPRWLTPLRQLLDLHADLPNMDGAVAAALFLIGTRETLPLLIELLDSNSPGAQIMALKTLALSTAFSDPALNRRDNGTLAPIFTDEMRRHSPPFHSGPQDTPGDIAFWKSWWAQNHLKLGFPDDDPKNHPPPVSTFGHELPAPYINPDGLVRGVNRFTLYGGNFGPENGCAGPASELCGVQVLLDGKPVELEYVNQLQINARIPRGEPGHPPARLAVISGGRTSDPYDLRQ